MPKPTNALAHRARRARRVGLAWLCGILAAVLAAVLAVPAAGQRGVVRGEMRLLPDGDLGIGEELVLEIRISTEATERSIPEPDFELENLRIVDGPSQASSLVMYNGRPFASRTLSWRLKPLRLGSARVYAVRVDLGEAILRLPERHLEILPTSPAGRRRPSDLERFRDPDPSDWAPPRPRRERERDPQIFLRAEVEPADPYVGQQVLYTVSLYTQVDIDSVSPEDVPDFRGFWARVIPQPDNLRPEMVDYRGERVGRVILLQRALFARRAGSFSIDPVRARLVAQLPEPGSRWRSQRREIERVGNAVRIDVRPLPPEPEGFQGAVGALSLRATLEPAVTAVGDAATLEIVLEGEGHLQGIAAPTWPEIPGVAVQPPQPLGEEEIVERTLRGRRVWDYVLVPDRAGRHVLPEIEMVVFDPSRGQYATLTTEPLVLEALNDAVESIHPIRSAALPSVGEAPGSSGLSGWLFSLPWGVGMIGWWLRRRRRDDADPARRDLFEALDTAAREERPRRAAQLLEEAWRVFLHAVLDLAREAPASHWQERLIDRGAPVELSRDIGRLAEDLHYLRNAPKLAATDDLRDDLVERSRRLARRFQ